MSYRRRLDSRPVDDPGEPSAWDRFWFMPESTSTIGVFRIVVGLLTFFWAVALAGDGFDFFSRRGILPRPSSRRYGLSLFAFTDSRPFIVALFVVLILAALCLIVGYRAKLAALIGFVIVLSLCRRNEYWVQGGDVLLRIMLFVLIFAPAGTALSLDSWRRGRSKFWAFARGTPWTRRLIQIQVSVIYLFAVWSKAQGESWVHGTAVGTSLHAEDLTRFQLPSAILDNLLLSNLATYGTLVVELALAILIWNRRLRPWVIAGGIGLHLFIETTFALGFFPIATVVAYIAFVPPDTMDRWLLRLREALKGSRFAPLRRIAAAEEPARA